MAQPVRPKGTYADYKSGNYSDKIFVFELVKKNSPNANMRSKETGKAVAFPLARPIPCVGTIFHKDKNSGKVYPRKIRYVPGENSIFVDEQTPDDKFPKVKVLANFVNGRLTVEGTDTPRVEFFMNWDMNETKEDRDPNKRPMFRLVDTSLLAKKAREKDDLEFDVVNWCRNASFESKIEPFASLYFTAEQMAQNAEDIRWNLTIMAKRNPAAFKRMLDDPNTERKILLKRAIGMGFVVVNPTQNSIAWAARPNAPFSVAAPGVDPLEDFANKSKSGDGERYYKAIYDMVNPVTVETTTFIPAPEVEDFNLPVQPIKGAAESDDELLLMVRTAVERNIMQVNDKKVWWKYKSENAQGEMKMVQKLRDNPVMLGILKGELGI